MMNGEPSGLRGGAATSKDVFLRLLVLITTVYIISNAIIVPQIVSSAGQFNVQGDEPTRIISVIADNGIHSQTTTILRKEPPDTAIIITSAWIPTHPSTKMIDEVITTTRSKIRGLASTAPIYVTVDHLLPKMLKQITDEERKERQATLDGYVTALYEKYLLDESIHIIANMENWHIGGSTYKALKLIQNHYPSVEYLYYMQHDFSWVRDVNHTALLETFKTYPEVNYIRFKYKPREGKAETCGKNYTQLTVVSQPDSTDSDNNNNNNNNMNLVENANIYHTSKYSDNNHLVRFDWYMETIGSFGKVNPANIKRPPEAIMQARAKSQGCHALGMYTYGRPGKRDEPVIRHLDGKRTKTLEGDEEDDDEDEEDVINNNKNSTTSIDIQ